MSTEIGLTNIFVKSNDDKITYIPRLFWGLDIFFRPVDRNALLNTYPRQFHHFQTPALKMQKMNYPQPAQFFSILPYQSVLLFGALDQPDFDNLYNSMSLTLGPSYRFARAFGFLLVLQC